MPQITTIRVVRRRSVQPEQFGNAAAEVEITGNVLEGEDHVAVARLLLSQSRKVVYENLGMPLPPFAEKQDKALNNETDFVKVEVETSEEDVPEEAVTKVDKPRGRGRPKKTEKQEDKTDSKPATKPADDDDIPDDEPNIRKSPENRVNPDDDIPGDDGDDDVPGDDTEEDDVPDNGSEEYTAEDLKKEVNTLISKGKLTTLQFKQIQRDLQVARLQDMSAEQIEDARKRIKAIVSGAK